MFTVEKRRWRVLLLTLIVLWHAGLALWMALSHPGPDMEYFYDEQYNIENVMYFFNTGSFKPANSWYSELSYLPQALAVRFSHDLFEATGFSALRMVQADGTIANVYLLCRLFGIVYGCAALLLMFEVGRRLHSPAVGLLASFLLSSSPWSIRASVEFKPDSLMLLGVVFAFLTIVLLLERPSTGRAALAGVGLGFAATAKLLGLFLAPVLAIATLCAAWRTSAGAAQRLWRTLLWGGVEILCCAGFFLVLSPYWRDFFAFLERNDRLYHERGVVSPFDFMAQVLADLPTRYFFGPWILGLACLGMVLALGQAFRRQPDEAWPPRIGKALAAVFVIFFLVASAIRLHFYKGNNLVPLLPFLALLAAAATWQILALLKSKPQWHQRAQVLAVLGLLFDGLWLGGRFSYEEHVPTTSHLMAFQLAERVPLDTSRVIYFEGREGEQPLYSTWNQYHQQILAAIRCVDSLKTVPLESLHLADAVILPTDLGKAHQASLDSLSKQLPHRQVLEVAPRFFMYRGPRYQAWLHPWQLQESSVANCRQGPNRAEWICTPPASWAAGEVVSLHFDFPNTALGQPQLEREGRKLELLLTTFYHSDSAWSAITERFVSAGGSEAVKLRFERETESLEAEEVSITFARWQPPAH